MRTLSSYPCSVRLRLEEPGDISSFPGATIRGAFGYTLRRMGCPDFSLSCASCLLRCGCRYAALLEPLLPAGMQQLTKAVSLPRPLVLRPKLDGQFLDIHIVFFGAAHAHLPAVIMCLDTMGREGIGARRTRYQRVAVTTPDGGIAVDHLQCAPIRPLRIEVAPGASRTGQAQLRFVTPLSLRRNGKAVPEFDPGLFFHGLMRRIDMLCLLYGETDERVGEREVILAAADSLTCRAAMRRHEQSRFSTRHRSRIDYSGLVGTVLLEGDIGTMLPLLRAGEITGAGNNTVFGNGTYVVEGVAPDEPPQPHSACLLH